MDRPPPPPPPTIAVISDDEWSPSPLRPKKKRPKDGIGPPPTVFVIDDDPTPRKPDPNRKTDPTRTPSFVPETPLDDDDAAASSSAFDASFVRCSLASRADPSAAKNNPPGSTGLIYLESDNESDCRGCPETPRNFSTGFGLVDYSDMGCAFTRSTSPMGAGHQQDVSEFCTQLREGRLGNNKKNMEVVTENGYLEGCNGNTDLIQTLGDSLLPDYCFAKDIVPQNFLQVSSYNEASISGQVDSTARQKGKHVADRSNRQNEAAARKKQQKEEKARVLEEKKRKRQEEKLQKEALKAEAAEIKKIEKEKQKWEKGKFAIKSIVAEIDTKVVENGSVGGHLLTRFAEKGLSYRITSNPFERSIMWKMSVPDQVSQLSSVGPEVPYVVLVYQAEEFCDLVLSESLIDNVRRVQSRYPSFTVCYITNKLMGYINKCEQAQYKKEPNVSSWRRPPVEEALSKLTTHFNNVHSRQCIDEAELAEHIVGLTSSLASCQFRKKLTQLSVHANGAIVPKDFIDKNLIKKNVWLKALVAIPKVQPRCAIAIWKRYPTMRSLLNVYMDPNKSVHDKEFLLKDLMIEGSLGKEDRRLGEICSKRVYRILMAQSGGIRTDDVEDGADLFGC
ncbi:crossover junction endonuclease EME1B isoform X1 [Iris pallida]|uniref:Crossover junction endonuclease EME1B isoform X1 n=1 Tax=Iris pallida TaxID=29817 RepID=A0AAX6F3I0_IRIPA|nr:crossover junction endonuclease EME1B isoform X1 [Iris pallida]